MEKRYPRTMMTTVCIPWDEKYNFEEQIFRRTIRNMINSGFKLIYLFGTAGEGYSVSKTQTAEIVKVFCEEMRGNETKPIVGIISLSLPEIIERIEQSYEYGIRDFQISFPSWGELSDKEVMVFFHEVCDRFPDSYFMHYNNAKRSRKKLLPADYARIAEEIPNLAAVKYMGPSYDEVIDMMESNSPIQFFLDELSFGYGCFLFECSLLISPLNINYRLAWDLFNAGLNKDINKVNELCLQVHKVNEMLFRCTSLGAIDSAYDKFYSKCQIPEFPLRLFPPYQSFTDAQFEAFRDMIKNELPHWLK